MALLEEDQLRIAEIARAVERAADRSLSLAVNDPTFVEALWLLLTVPIAMKEKDPSPALAELGIHVPADPTLTEIMAAFGDAVDRLRRRATRGVTDFGLLACNAAMSALLDMTAEREPQLWQATPEDQRTTIATFVSTERFGELAQRFFTNVLEGHLHYFLDREIPRQIDRGGRFKSVGDTGAFEAAVRNHCRETTLIMRAFARDWLGANRYHRNKDLTRKDTAAFASYAFKKVRGELNRRSAMAA
ncbi:MAG: hypothetical protein ACTHLC_12945 [Rhizobiaceae bacterium]